MDYSIIGEEENVSSNVRKQYMKAGERIKEIKGLVNLAHLDSSFIFEMKYATEENFTGRVIYPSKACILRKETALKLIKAHEEFKNSGYRLKIWDAYRPKYVQRIFWDIVKDERFVATPDKSGSRHSLGTAVDLTLTDNYGNELRMPSAFDDFSSMAYRDNQNMGVEERRNLNFLTEVMERHGFVTIDTEWWHFEDSVVIY